MRPILLLLITASIGWCAAPDTIWTKLFGNTETDFATGGTADFSGGYVLTGAYTHPAPSPRGQDLYAVRVDALTGDTIYARTFGGNQGDQGADVHYGSFRTLFVGATSSFGANTPNVYAVATNAVGDTLWTRAFDSGFPDAALAVDRTPAGDYYIAGYETGSGNFDLLLMKMDSTGTLLWTRTLGGIRLDWTFDVLALSDNGCVVAGETASFGVNADQRTNAWVVRYDGAGDTLWTRAIGDSAHHERFDEVILANDGGFLFTGYQEHPPASQDILVVKTDSDGNVEWSRSYGGAADDRMLDVVASCESYTLAGYSYSYGAGGQDGYLMEIDELGDTLWTKSLGGAQDELFYALHSSCSQWYDAGYYVTGKSASNANGPSDAWLVKLGADPQIEITSPAHCDQFVIGATVNVTWQFQGLEAFPYLSLELNRDYPTGAWELLNPSFYNTGFQNFTSTSPASNNCRLRITKLDGSAYSTISDEFSIVPQGMLQYPPMDWDSSYNQAVIREIEYVERDGGFAYSLGRALHKRDSIGGALWDFVSSLHVAVYDVSAGPICELENGDLLTVLTVDSSGTNDPSWVSVLACDSAGNGVVVNAGGRPSARGAVGVEILADDVGGFWVVAQTYSDTGSYTPLPAVLRYPQDSNLQLLDMFFCFATCAVPNDSGLLIAAYSGDPFSVLQNVHLIQLNDNYDTLWTRTYDFGENELPVRLIELSNGNLMMLGQLSPWIGATSRSFYLELSPQGDSLHSWIYSERDNTQMYGIAEDVDGRMVSSGTTNFVSQQREFLLTKFDCDGQPVWEEQYGGANSESFYDVKITNDLGYLAAGSRFFPSGPGLGDDRGTVVKFGSETYYQPPACLPADSLVIRYDATLNANVLTWVGPDQGAYFIYTSSVYDSLFPSGNWSQTGCTEAGPPPAASVISWTDYNVTPETKFYRVVHGCNQSCGGGEN